MNNAQIDVLKDRVLAGGQITQDEALALSAAVDKEALYAAADQIRAHFMGRTIDLCSIMNAQSGRCSEDCKWCSQSRRFKTGVEEYPLVSEEEGVEMALANSRQGVGRFSLVTSGRALKPKQVQQACNIYTAIGKKSTIRLCASMGLLRKPELQKLKDAGVERYHCNIETAASHFPSLCSTHTFEDKLRTIRDAQSIGMKVCSGGIFGMGETLYDKILGSEKVPVRIYAPVGVHRDLLPYLVRRLLENGANSSFVNKVFDAGVPPVWVIPMLPTRTHSHPTGNANGFSSSVMGGRGLSRLI